MAAFQIQVVDIGQGALSHRAVVLCPTRPIVVGRAKLDEVNAGTELNAMDRWLLDQVEQTGASIAVFRGVGADGARAFTIDPELDERDAEQLGYVLTRGLLPVHRRMVKAGVTLLAHCDFGPREHHAMRVGVRRMLETLEARPRAHPAVQEMDLWILRHLLFHFGMPFEHIVKKVLPDHLRLIAARSARARELVARLPHAAID